MKLNVVKNLKIWLIATLAVVVLGMTFLGVFGLNSTSVQGAHYEITVGVDQDINGASQNAKLYAETYFAEKGIKDVDYSYQTMKDGATHVYKFNSATGIDAEELSAYVTEKLANDKVVVESSVSQVVASSSNNVWGLVIALGVSAVAVFVYLAIMEKLFATISVLVSGAISAIITLSLVAITRIPVVQTWALAISASIILSSILSLVIISRCKEQSKLDTKADSATIAEKAVSNSMVRFAFVFIALVLVAVLLGLIGGIGYLTFIALTILVVVVSAVFTSLVWTPIVWSAMNK